MTWPSGEAALVTGAASGIGLGVARALVAAGASVAITDIDAERLNAVAKELTANGGTAVAFPFDVSDIGGWEALADRAEAAVGPISIVCSIAGVNGGGTAETTTAEVWKWVFRVNTDSQFAAAATFIPRFRKRGGRAHLLNTSSISGFIPQAGVAAYTASKFACTGLTMALREELKDTQIGVSLLIPGAVATRINYSASEAEAREFGGSVDLERAAANSELLMKGADPDRVGEQVVEAIAADEMYIVTHREWGERIDEVFGEVAEAYERFDGRHGADPVVQAMKAGASVIH